MTVVFRNGIQHLAHPMTDIILHNITYEKEGQDNTDDRECEVQVINAGITESIGEKIVGIVQGVFQRYRSKTAANTNQYAEDQYKLSQFDMT